jgi:hypothetical protein
MTKLQFGQDPDVEIAIVLFCFERIQGIKPVFIFYIKNSKSEFLVGVILEGGVPVVVVLLEGGGEVVLSECRVDVVVLLDGDVKSVLLEGGE